MMSFRGKGVADVRVQKREVAGRRGRVRTPAGLVACFALALLWFPGAARAEVRGDSVPRAGYIAWEQVIVRSQPNAKAPRVAVLKQFRPDFRPRVVLALGSRFDSKGQPAWYRISLAGRPNGRTGWVPAESVDVKPTREEILIDLSDRRLELRVRGKVQVRTTVAVGAPGMETPRGLFYVVAKFRPANPFLGVFAFETSAYSPTLTDWPGGGIVGIHGTSVPSLLGQAVSHGCVRVANSAMLRLARLTPVGTPIRVVR
jgi:lipoprotein-anchoring transpeptidase ErfK/SrfK